MLTFAVCGFLSPTPRIAPRRSGSISMLKDSYDLVVLGGGPVGITGALRATSLGKSAILVDATPQSQFQFTGPTGLFSKALRDGSLRIDVPVLRSMGIGDAAIWAQVRELVDSILRKSGDGNARALSLARIPHLRGFGRLAPSDDGKIAVDVEFTGSGKGSAETRRTTLRATNALLATGSKAVRLDALGDLYTTPVLDAAHGAETRCFESDSIKGLSFLPRSVVIVGGGIIAIEFARIFAELDAKVTMVVRSSDLPTSLARVGIDRDLALALQRELQTSGIRILFDSEVSDHAVATRGRSAKERRKIELGLTRTGSAASAGRKPIYTDIVLTATGRKAVAGSLGLETMGVELARNGDVPVDGQLQTVGTCDGCQHVYGAGDVVGAPQLASTGIQQAESAVETMFREGGATKGACSPADMIADCARFPVGIWTVPEVAFVGLTAAAAEEQGISVVEGLGKYSESIRGHVHTVGTTKEGEYLQMRGGKQPRITGQTLKLVATRAAPHTVVGVHIFGDDACELVHFGTTLVQAQKTLAEVLQVCYAAVTYHELFKLAARDALSTVVADGWRDVYRQINHGSDTTPAHAEEWLTAQGVEAEAVANVVKAMFASGAVLGEDSFLRRVGRLQGPLGLDRVET